jgi:hypothetical protein
MAELPSYSMRFSGRLLKRGFWLYIWNISAGKQRYLYIGRTGDSSSPNAASPFQRIGHHLDSRSNAKANSMARQLKGRHVDPLNCEFEMTAIGPLFEEQGSFEAHKPIRDRVGALEFALAKELEKRGYTVIWNHSSNELPERDLWMEVCQVVDKRFPNIKES